MYPLLVLVLVLLTYSCQPTPTTTNNSHTNQALPKQKDSLLAPQALPLFKATKENFSIYFPTPPQISTKEKEVDIGNLRMKQWVSKDAAGQYYVVSCADYPNAVLQLGSKQQLLKGVEARLLTSLHAKEINNQEIKLDETHPGMSFQAQAKRQHWYLNYHLYLVDNRLYQLGIHSAIGAISEQDSLDFFGSFEVVD